MYDLKGGARLDEEIRSFYLELVKNPALSLVDVPAGVNVSYTCHRTGEVTEILSDNVV